MPSKPDTSFQHIFNNHLVGMLLSDESHVITDINDHLLTLTGLQRSGVVGKTGLQLGFLNEAFVRRIWQLMDANEPIINQELQLVNERGEITDCLFSTEGIVLEGKKYWLTAIIDISLRKKAEKELADVYNRISDGFVAFDKQWNYTYVNMDAGKLMGKDPDEVVGKNVWKLFPHLVGSEIEQAYVGAMQRQEMVHLEQYFPPTDTWYMHMIYPSPHALSVFFKVITQRKKAEQQIEESELRFRTLTRTAPVGIFETDNNGVTTYVNETWLMYTGMQLQEALGNGWLNAVHPDDRQQILQGWQNKAGKKEESISEYRLVDKQGNLRWVNGKAVPVINSEGEVTGYIGTISDVTSLKNTVALLEKKEQTLQKAQQISKIGNWEFYFDTEELYWSKEVYRIFDLEEMPPDKLYMAYRNRFHPDDLAGLDDKIKSAIDTASGFSHDHRIICSDGSIKYILAIGEVIVNNEGIVIGLKGTGQDITERKEAESSLQKSSEQLRELSSHLQEIREQERLHIAREIHDELGQQLTALKMDISWLKKKILTDDTVVMNKFNDAIALVDDTVKSIRRITSELRPSIIDDLGLNAALEWHIKEFKERVLDIEFNYENSFDDNNIDPLISIGLFRILQESLNNIAKHAAASQVTIKIEKIKDSVKLFIRDNGVGFEMRTKHAEHTFGHLGIKERVSKMKGKSSIKSKPGAGTTIEVSLPLI